MAVPLSHRESADTYCRVIHRSGRWRIIAGACGVQWALQRQTRDGGPAGARWQALHYFRRRETAIRLWQACSGENASVLAKLLPARFKSGDTP